VGLLSSSRLVLQITSMGLSSPWTEVGSSDESHLKFGMPAYETYARGPNRSLDDRENCHCPSLLRNRQC
jgi:hypothetical protein